MAVTILPDKTPLGTLGLHHIDLTEVTHSWQATWRSPFFVNRDRYGIAVPSISSDAVLDEALLRRDTQGAVLSTSVETRALLDRARSFKTPLVGNGQDDFYYLPGDIARRDQFIDARVHQMHFGDSTMSDMFAHDLRETLIRFERVALLSSDPLISGDPARLAYGLQFRSNGILDMGRAEHTHGNLRLNLCKIYRGPPTFGRPIDLRGREIGIGGEGEEFYFKGEVGWPENVAIRHVAPSQRHGDSAPNGRIGLFAFAAPRELVTNLEERLLKAA